MGVVLSSLQTVVNCAAGAFAKNFLWPVFPGYVPGSRHVSQVEGLCLPEKNSHPRNRDKHKAVELGHLLMIDSD